VVPSLVCDVGTTESLLSDAELVLDAGEVNGENMMADLQEQPGTKTAVMQLAARYHGIGIAWEHRYYGDSVPFVQVLHFM
jgi:hypothetical protein